LCNFEHENRHRAIKYFLLGALGTVFFADSGELLKPFKSHMVSLGCYQFVDCNCAPIITQLISTHFAVIERIKIVIFG
jgi:hypothetical protein